MTTTSATGGGRYEGRTPRGADATKRLKTLSQDPAEGYIDAMIAVFILASLTVG